MTMVGKLGVRSIRQRSGAQSRRSSRNPNPSGRTLTAYVATPSLTVLPSHIIGALLLSTCVCTVLVRERVGSKLHLSEQGATSVKIGKVFSIPNQGRQAVAGSSTIRGLMDAACNKRTTASLCVVLLLSLNLECKNRVLAEIQQFRRVFSPKDRKQGS